MFMAVCKRERFGDPRDLHAGMTPFPPHTQSGVSKLLVDTLNGTSFTIIGDDSDLNWAVAQVGGRTVEGGGEDDEEEL